MPKVPQPAKPPESISPTLWKSSGMAKIAKTSSRSSATRGHLNRENLRERKVTPVIIRHSGHGHVTKQPRGDNDDADGAIVGKIHNMRIRKFFLQHVVLQKVLQNASQVEQVLQQIATDMVHSAASSGTHLPTSSSSSLEQKLFFPKPFNLFPVTENSILPAGGLGRPGEGGERITDCRFKVAGCWFKTS